MSIHTGLQHLQWQKSAPAARRLDLGMQGIDQLLLWYVADAIQRQASDHLRQQSAGGPGDGSEVALKTRRAHRAVGGHG
jgi:hypothetical protein